MNKRSESAKGATTLHTGAVDWTMRPRRNQPGLVRLGGSSIAIFLALLICLLACPGSARADRAACLQACAGAYESCLGNNWPGLDKISYCIYEMNICWHACPNDPGPGGGPAAGGGPGNGEPVDTGTGIFTYEHTDLSLADVIPFTLTHTYRAQDTGSRAFGIGVSDNYDVTLYVDTGGSYTLRDALANCCKMHDCCYDFCQGRPGTCKRFRRCCMAGCDEYLIGCAVGSAPPTTWGQIYREAILLIFPIVQRWNSSYCSPST